MLTKLQEENPDLVVAKNLGNVDGNVLASSAFSLDQSSPALSSGSIADYTSPARVAPHSVQSTQSVPECGVGTWCEELSSPETDTYASPTPVPIACQPGQWCE